jgi:dUTP pyrophosphatase
MRIFFKALNDNARVPTKGTGGSACYDLYAAEETKIYPGQVASIGTGLQLAFGPEYVLHIFSRSGLAKEGIALANSVGVIDSDYRGEIRILLANIGFEGVWRVKRGDRIAQCAVEKIIPIEWIEEGFLDETERGEGGFGSTGN